MALKLGATASKASLRDAMNRLRSIRKRCKKDDQEEEGSRSTGDPFRDICISVDKDLAELRENITERNVGAKKFGSDHATVEQSHAINRGFMDVQKQIDDMRAMIEKDEASLAKAHRKKKSKGKIDGLEKQINSRRIALENTVAKVESCKGLDDERAGTRTGASVQQAQALQKKMKLKEQLFAGGSAGKYAAGDDGSADLGTMGGKGRLEDNEDTKNQMAKIKQQDAEMNKYLDRIRSGVGRLGEAAHQIGQEIDTQNAMLDNAEQKMDSQVKQLKTLNRRLKGLTKKTKPMNMMVNLGCGILLLALVGYFLYTFGVV